MKSKWEIATLGEVCHVYQPQTLAQKDLKQGPYPVFGANGQIGWHTDFNHENEELAIGCRGSVGSVHITPKKTWINGNAMVVRPKDSRITIALLKYAFLGGIKISDAISGTAQPQITRTSLSPLKICFPTARAQQDQLAKKLDEAFAGLAKAKENAAQNLQNARALFESCLDQIFSENARKWPRRTIGEIAEVYDGPHATPKTVGEGPIFLGISSLNDGKINLGETRHVTPSDFKKWTRRVKPKTDDVVFSYETRLGQAAVVPKDMECCLGRRMGLVRLKHEVCDPFFFVYQYISPPFRSFLKSKTIKGTTVDRISLREFPSFPISLPGIDEQRRLVEKILFVQVEIQKLSSVYNHKNAGVAELKKSILHEAFSGNL